MTDEAIAAAADAVAAGEAVVYPTETVYGLGADALDAAAVERVYEIKGRSRSNPLSLGAADVATALDHAEPSDRAERFARAFLPGPVTVVVARGPEVPDALTAGRDRVGLRVPDHEVAQELLAATGPVTATSANRSGTGSVRRVEELSGAVQEAAGAVVDGGETPGAESTVVDPEQGEVIRRGARAEAVERWLADHGE